MAERVQAFFRTHPPEAGDVAALTRFEEVVQRAERLAGQQRAGLVAARAATLQRATVRRTIQRKLLRYLSAVGAVAAKDKAELLAEFRLPGKAARTRPSSPPPRGCSPGRRSSASCW